MIARDTIKVIYDLLKKKVKFNYHGGQTVKCEDGRTFQKTHYDAARNVIRIMKEKRRNPHGD